MAAIVRNVRKGSIYMVKHDRFGGPAKVKVIAYDREFVDLKILEGSLVGINTTWNVDDVGAFRREHCQFTSIEKGKKE
jgi:hypothetical protein